MVAFFFFFFAFAERAGGKFDSTPNDRAGASGGDLFAPGWWGHGGREQRSKGERAGFAHVPHGGRGQLGAVRSHPGAQAMA